MKTNRAILFILFCMSLFGFNAFAQNNWLDTDGNYINAHGGGILTWHDKYYWFGEHRPDHGGETEVGITCYSSSNLQDWKYEGVALSVSEKAGDDIERGCIMERPKVIHCEKTGKFVMYFHLELKGKGYEAARFGVATSDSPTGPYIFLYSSRSNPGVYPSDMTEEQRNKTWDINGYKWWTPEWTKAVGDGMFVQRDLQGGQMSRDMTLYIDDDGKAYHIYSSEENLTLQIAELTDDFLHHSGRYVRVAPAGHNEAPTIFKHDGTYWMITSGCTGWAPNEARMFSAPSILGPWKQHPTPFKGKGSETTYGGQGTYILQLPDGNFIFMADVWKPESLKYSGYLWLPIEFDKDNVPFIHRNDFTVGKGTFLLNGEPFVIKAAELHYPRIPREYWDHRIKMCKALGMNAICLYVFWNIHEQKEGEFDFSGNNDVAEFCRLAQKNGMYVIVRPGPYVCAEWEMGGLPWWLLKKKDIRLREQDPYFMERVGIFEKKVAEQLAPLSIQRGGPIIMVQVENEYGSYGEDKEYIAAIRDMLKACWHTDGTGPLLFQCDWASNFTLNGLDDLIWTMNFGTGANIDKQFERLAELRPDSPKMCSEFWSGWFDKWGARHETRPASDMVAGIDEMLSKGISFSLYMTHGGTSFGHWAGANSPGFAPDVTSYDYDAPINEYGQATEKYFELQKTLKKYGETSELPQAPAELISIPDIKIDRQVPLVNGICSAIKDRHPLTFEEMEMGWGSAFYTTILPEIPSESIMTVDVHDYAQVFINGRRAGSIDRVKNERSIVLPPVHAGDRLVILVEAMGRINFGRAIKDYKGLVSDVTISTDEKQWTLEDWTMVTIPDDYDTAANAFSRKKSNEYDFLKEGEIFSSYSKGHFNLERTGDTFINMEQWGKGQVYVNGHPLGRYWSIGPQQTLYCPGCWLKEGKNEILVLDVIGTGTRKKIWAQDHPELDKLQLEKSSKHNDIGNRPDLNSLQPVLNTTAKEGNGWQIFNFAKNATGRYLAIEIGSTKDGGPAAIAEIYLRGEDGRRVGRESWTTRYADSENELGNHHGDKVFDLQESTYWQTEKASAFPHLLVIDLGKEETVSALEYLPRAEQGAPGSIDEFKVFIL